MQRTKIKFCHMAKTFKIGRDARTGEFIPVRKAEVRKSTAVVETIRRKK